MLRVPDIPGVDFPELGSHTERVSSRPIACQCSPCCQRVAATLRAIRAGGRVGVDLPSTTKTTEAKPATESTVEAKAWSETAMEGEGAGSESTVEAKARSETAMEGEGAGSESTMEAKATMEGKATTEAKPTSETAMEAKAASAKAAPAEADCGKAVIARVRDTEGAPAWKGRRSQR